MRKSTALLYACTFVCLIFITTVRGAIEIYEFKSAAQEQRFNSLILLLRCPTCQNQSLADSNSVVAKDLKQIVYEKIIAGESNEQILAFMKKRYGEFILYQPELSQSNLLLWLGPLVFFILFLSGFFVWYQSNKGNIDND